jgi:hypothetical protein
MTLINSHSVPKIDTDQSVLRSLKWCHSAGFRHFATLEILQKKTTPKSRFL